ncbi:hypothetical protein ABT298_28955 [Streptomyces sp. NPDC001034]|uniref:hypothetical protein n=1 Tax=Streptomyces sp. NPDC001034 TaxID=3154375 RepID=UPI0033212F14
MPAVDESREHAQLPAGARAFAGQAVERQPGLARGEPQEFGAERLDLLRARVEESGPPVCGQGPVVTRDRGGRFRPRHMLRRRCLRSDQVYSLSNVM